MQETQKIQVRSLSRVDLLEESMATHCNTFAWRIPDRGACQATAHGAAKSWTWLKWLNTRACLTLCDPMDCSLPGPSVHGISHLLEVSEWGEGRGWGRNIFLVFLSIPNHSRITTYKSWPFRAIRKTVCFQFLVSLSILLLSIISVNFPRVDPLPRRSTLFFLICWTCRSLTC